MTPTRPLPVRSRPSLTSLLLAAAAIAPAATPAVAQPAVETPATSGPLTELPQESVPAPAGPVDPLALPPAEAPLGEPAAGTDFFDALTGGKVKVNVRGRYESADFSTLDDQSHSTTLRTRLGYLTGDWLGLQGYVEFEDVRAADDEAYNAAGLNGVFGRPVIADPEVRSEEHTSELQVTLESRMPSSA